jgi:pyruvyltransferase
VTYATLFVALNLMLRTQFSRLLRLSLRRLNKFRIVRSIIDKYRGIADHSFDKNRRYSLTNFLYPSVELSFYRPEARYHAVNFGDELSLITVGLMLARRGATIFDCTDRPRQLVAVGSVLHMAREGATIWGTGVHGSVPDFGHVYHKLDVRAVRGPLTRRFLQQRGIQVPEIYGDPGLLVPILTAGRFAVTGEYEVGFVPNFHDREHLDAQQFGKRFPDINIIDPLRAWNLVIADILKCKFVMASSLHGIVTAESFGIPARYVRLTEHEALLKYEDYFEGTGRPVSFASSVEQALDMGGIALGGYDPAPLLAAFPYDLWNLA